MRNMLLRGGLVALLAALMVACGSPAASDTTGAPSPAASAAPSAAALPTSTPEPAMTTTTTKGDDSQLDLIASLTRSGGLQGRTETLLVERDGTLALLNGATGGVFRTAQASPAQIQQLEALLASAEWQQLAADYGRPVPDAFSYTVTGGGLRVTTYDGAENPPVLENVLGQLNALWQVAQVGG